MTDNLKMSRITKALTDRSGSGIDFDAAEARLAAVRVAVILSPALEATPAGQAAALTAVATSAKCFGNVVLCAHSETPLIRSLAIGRTVGAAAAFLGAAVVSAVPADATHTVFIGDDCQGAGPFAVRSWWDGWLAGVVPAFDERAVGASGNPLAGIFSGALAVREVFATVLGLPRSGARVSIASVWEPWLKPEQASAGPAEVYLPRRLWFIGLGHLGQGYLWSLGFLRASGIAILQDDQFAGVENEATGLLTEASDVGVRKTRVAARWLDGSDWETFLIERRHHGDLPLRDDDPPVVITGLDDPQPRLEIARAGFPYMIDAGVGHGPVDFESLQISVLAKGADPLRFWSAELKPKDVAALLAQDAYRRYADKPDCGAVPLAKASVAVPFVGAAVGALVIAQAIRLGCMRQTAQILTMQLASPAMATAALSAPPPTSFGSLKLTF